MALPERPSLPSLPARYSARWVESALTFRLAQPGRVPQGIALLVVAAAFLGTAGPWDGAVHIGSLRGLLSLAFGYQGVAWLVNTAHFHLDRQGLRVRQGPLPWFGGRLELPRSRIEQIHCQVGTTRADGRPASFEVVLTLEGGQTRKVASGVASLEEARDLERHMEAALGIADRRMPFEAPRPEDQLAAGEDLTTSR